MNRRSLLQIAAMILPAGLVKWCGLESRSAAADELPATIFGLPLIRDDLDEPPQPSVASLVAGWARDVVTADPDWKAGECRRCVNGQLVLLLTDAKPLETQPEHVAECLIVPEPGAWHLDVDCHTMRAVCDSWWTPNHPPGKEWRCGRLLDQRSIEA